MKRYNFIAVLGLGVHLVVSAGAGADSKANIDNSVYFQQFKALARRRDGDPFPRPHIRDLLPDFYRLLAGRPIVHGKRSAAAGCQSSHRRLQQCPAGAPTAELW